MKIIIVYIKLNKKIPYEKFNTYYQKSLIL